MKTKGRIAAVSNDRMVVVFDSLPSTALKGSEVEIDVLDPPKRFMGCTAEEWSSGHLFPFRALFEAASDKEARLESKIKELEKRTLVERESGADRKHDQEIQLKPLPFGWSIELRGRVLALTDKFGRERCLYGIYGGAYSFYTPDNHTVSAEECKALMENRVGAFKKALGWDEPFGTGDGDEQY